MPNPSAADLHVDGMLDLAGDTPPEPSAPPFDSMGAYLGRMFKLLKAKVGDAITTEVWSDCVARARGHAGGKAKAHKRNAGEIAAIEPLTAAEEGASLWLGLWLPADAAAGLALTIDGAEPAASLHLTLLYFGALDTLAADAVDRARVAVAAYAMANRPIDLHVCGLARFQAGEGSDGKDVLYACVESEHLDWYRDRLLDAAMAVGLQAQTTHQFHPHITLAYLEPGANPGPLALPDVELTISELTLSTRGSREAFTLAGLGYDGPPLASSEPIEFAVTLSEYIEPPAWIPYLPSPGTYKHPVYGSVKLPAERIAHFVDQFNAGVYQSKVPLDAEHETKLSGAVGWITALRQNEDGSADAAVEWTDRGATLLREDRFRYVSPEWYDEWTAPDTGAKHTDIAIGGAITTRPFFKDGSLRPMAATEAEPAPEPSATASKEDAMTVDTDAARTAAEAAEARAAETSTQMAELQTQMAELKAQRAADQAVITTQAEQLKSASESLVAIETASRHRRFRDEIEGRTERSTRTWFGEPAKHLTVLETLAATFGEDSDQVKDYVGAQSGVAEAMHQSGIFKGSGSSQRDGGTGDPQARMDSLARARATEKGIGIGEATRQIMSEQPDLARAAGDVARVRV